MVFVIRLLLDLNESLENYLISKLENIATWFLFKWYVIKDKSHKRAQASCEI